MRALSYATGKSSDDVSPWVEALESKFGASGYAVRALFAQVAVMPEAYEVTSKPLTAPTRVSMASNPK